MVAAASEAGLEDARVLEIGGGIGTLQAELLERGAEEGEVVELVPAWEPYARELARERGIEERTSFRIADVLEQPESVEPADIVVMNRVVCCSPDGVALAAQAARLARRSLVLSFPRDVIWVRIGLGLMNAGLRIARRPFRVFVHPPADLVRAAESAGMTPRGERTRRAVGLRRAATAAMTELGLFPLPLVLLPSEHVPLHIFEERYKDLIGECLEDDSEFGLVFADEAGIREIGTRAAVLEVLTRFEDGRMNIVIEGRDRFRLHDLTEGRSFQTGDVTPLDDMDDPAEPETVSRAEELFGRLRELTSSDVAVPDPDTPQLSYVLASRVELTADVKLELLAETSERVRLERVCELLEEAAAHRRAAATRSRARRHERQGRSRVSRTPRGTMRLWP